MVGIDSSQSCISSPRQGACVRYIKEKATHPTEYIPPVLFICGDMTKPLFEGDNKYANIVTGSEPATTPYLKSFAGHTEFDVISCQMAIHYACSSDEAFETFATNLETHGKGMFFGTCLDGAAVYSLMMGKQSHMFRSGAQVFGEFVKEYDDGQGWTEDFGKAVSVHLESFELTTMLSRTISCLLRSIRHSVSCIAVSSSSVVRHRSPRRRRSRRSRFLLLSPSLSRTSVANRRRLLQSLLLRRRL